MQYMGSLPNETHWNYSLYTVPRHKLWETPRWSEDYRLECWSKICVWQNHVRRGPPVLLCNFVHTAYLPKTYAQNFLQEEFHLSLHSPLHPLVMKFS